MAPLGTQAIKYVGKSLTPTLVRYYMTTWKDTKEDLEQWRDVPYLWKGKDNILKMSASPNASIN